MQRIFIVGCPRSGTTLVQAMLARHPTALSLPETAFFEHLYGNAEWRWGDSAARPRRRLRQRLGLAHKQGREVLDALRGQLPHDVGRFPRRPLRTASCVRRFIGMLDACARADGRGAWIEKTPSHLLYIPEIERYVPDARFVHVIRQGEDVLASIMDASMRYAEKGIFSGGTARWSLRWNRAASIHREHALRPHHHFVFLEDLIHDTPGEWRRLCGFLGFDPHAELTGNVDGLITDVREEPWKNEAVSGQPSKPRRKAESIFGPQVLEWLQRTLMPYDELRRNCIRGG
jgi:hypothetical protein